MFRDRLTLARRIANALVDIGVDAAASRSDRSLPLSPRALTDVAVFERLVRRESSVANDLPPGPVTIVPTAIAPPSSNCQNTIFETTWENASSGSSAPRSVFVKQSCADFSRLLFANVIGFWKIECAFYRNLASMVPIPMPRVHSVVERRSRFVIVMENLLDRSDTHLFVNRDLLEGVDTTRAKRCLQALAQLHARFDALSAAERERALPYRLHPFLSSSLKPVMLAVNRLAVARCHERAPDTFDEGGVALYSHALDHWETLSNAWYQEPLTLVHGDSHLGNFFETGDEMGMTDFQAAHWSKGIRDVQYFLINSMHPERLVEHERELVAAYCEEVARLGAPLSFEEGWQQYRGFSFQSLMTAVVSRGLGSFTDSDAVMQVMLERAVSATRRLGFGEWLDARLQGRGGDDLGCEEAR